MLTEAEVSSQIQDRASHLAQSREMCLIVQLTPITYLAIISISCRELQRERKHLKYCNESQC